MALSADAADGTLTASGAQPQWPLAGATREAGAQLKRLPAREDCSAASRRCTGCTGPSSLRLHDAVVAQHPETLFRGVWRNDNPAALPSGTADAVVLCLRKPDDDLHRARRWNAIMYGSARSVATAPVGCNDSLGLARES